MGIPVARYRPSSASDGEGGFIDTYDDPYEFFGSIVIHQNMPKLIVDRMEDIQVDDVISVEDEIDLDPAFYRVVEALQPSRGAFRTFTLERRDRPIWPLPAEYLTVDGIAVVIDGHYLTVN